MMKIYCSNSESMAKNEMNTEVKILEAANCIFHLYGYHGTNIQQIATEAGVNKAAIHYYFRSKENIYSLVLMNNLSLLFEHLNYIKHYPGEKSVAQAHPDLTWNIETGKIAWFLINEVRTNNQLIRKMVRTNNKMDNLITSIFTSPESLKFIETMIKNHISEIMNQELPEILILLKSFKKPHTTNNLKN